MARCSRKKKAVLFGSGWLYDIPLADVAGAFEKVILVDLLHPFATRRAVRRYSNVTLLSADITDSIEAVWRVSWTRGATLPVARPALFVGDRDVDLVVSVNLLSQLPCTAETYLRRGGEHGEQAIFNWCRGVIRAHLDYLRRLPGVVAIITDTEVRTISAV